MSEKPTHFGSWLASASTNLENKDNIKLVI
jgi:hypothetical protein